MATVAIQPGLFTPPPRPRLRVGLCPACADRHFPAADYCPYCGADGIRIDEVGATATLYLHTIVHRAPPGYSGPVPYGFGLVDLPEGLRVISRLVAEDLAALRSGMPMRLAVTPLYEDPGGNRVLSWAYAPTGDGAT